MNCDPLNRHSVFPVTNGFLLQRKYEYVLSCTSHVASDYGGCSHVASEF